jgi:predicted ferric reductase
MSEIKTMNAPDAFRDLISDWMLWFGLLGGAIAWLIHLVLAYAIAEFGCVSPFHDKFLWGFSGVAWLITAVTVMCLAIASASLFLARRSQARFASAVVAMQVEPHDVRVFMSRFGVITSNLFILFIVVQTIPILFYLRGC